MTAKDHTVSEAQYPVFKINAPDVILVNNELSNLQVENVSTEWVTIDKSLSFEF